jgi:sterol-4alpha-carboxylate 3-dehydrogenase (decarboxylating)
LVARGDPVAIFDIVQRYHDVPFYSGDISDQAQVSDAIKKVPSLSCTFPSVS